MSRAYYIVLDNKTPGFDTFVNGKAVAREMDAISAIATTLGLSDIHGFASFADSAADFEIDPMLPAACEVWFSADEGVKWIVAIREHIKSNPSAVTDHDAVIADLNEYEGVLRHAAEIEAKWHFAMDF